MSSYSDLPSSMPLRPQQGSGLFSSIGKALRSAPILSTGLALAPFPQAKALAPIAASLGLGKRKRKVVRRKKQQGGLSLKKLGKAALPLLKKSGVLGELAKKIPSKHGPALSKAVKAVGFGQRKKLKKGGRKARRRIPKPQLVPIMAM